MYSLVGPASSAPVLASAVLRGPGSPLREWCSQGTREPQSRPFPSRVGVAHCGDSLCWPVVFQVNLGPDKMVVDLTDPNRPRFTLQELKDVLQERNKLKSQLLLVQEELQCYRRWAPLSGLPRCSRPSLHHYTLAPGALIHFPDHAHVPGTMCTAAQHWTVLPLVAKGPQYFNREAVTK